MSQSVNCTMRHWSLFLFGFCFIDILILYLYARINNIQDKIVVILKKKNGAIFCPYLPTMAVFQRPLSSVPKVAAMGQFNCMFFIVLFTCILTCFFGTGYMFITLVCVFEITNCLVVLPPAPPPSSV